MTPELLETRQEAGSAERGRTPAAKIKTLTELIEIVSRAKAQGKRVIHCHGVFDLIHVGHIRHLTHAQREGDLLVVTVTPDKHVNKGPGRPAFPQELHRWYLGDPGYSEEEVQAQRAFTQLFPPEYIGYGTRSRICVSFMRRHPHLMPHESVAVPAGSEPVAWP